MDQEGRGDRIESSNKNLTQVGEGVNENSKDSVNGIISETVVSNSEENVCFGGENVYLRLQNDDFGSLKNPKMDNGGGISQPLNQNDSGSSRNSSGLVDGSVLESEERGLGEKNIREISSEVSAERRDGSINQETSEMRVVGQVDQGSSTSLHNSVDGFVVETVTVINTQEVACPDGNNRALEVKGVWEISQPLNQNDSGSSGNSSGLVDGSLLESEERGLGEKNNREISSEVSAERRDGSINQETSEMRVVGQVDQGSSTSLHNSVDGFVVETVTVINTQEVACPDGNNRVLEVKDNGLDSSKVLPEKPKEKFSEAQEASCVIDIKGGGGGRRFKESWDGDRVCRICHLSTEQSLESSDGSSITTSTVDLIQLGCGCKDELGIAHSHCAEAWFKLKGNRMCEICGQTAKNITGVRDDRFIEDWHDQGSSSGGGGALERRGGCWRGQPFCNFLMACLVIAFVLPWFFRVNMF